MDITQAIVEKRFFAFSVGMILNDLRNSLADVNKP